MVRQDVAFRLIARSEPGEVSSCAFREGGGLVTFCLWEIGCKGRIIIHHAQGREDDF